MCKKKSQSRINRPQGMRHLNFHRIAQSVGYSYNRFRFSRTQEEYTFIVMAYSKNLYCQLGTIMEPEQLKMVLKELNTFHIAHATNTQYSKIRKFVNDEYSLSIKDLHRIYKYCRHILK